MTFRRARYARSAGRSPPGTAAIAFALAAWLSASSGAHAGEPPRRPAAEDATAGLADAMLRVHNRERAEVGVAPLTWSPALAEDAQVWADVLAATGAFRHSTVPDEGENLAQGSKGRFGAERLAQWWADEKAYFAPGVFPNVSRNGDWEAVGHYTQMIWRGTREVGCAMSQGSWQDVLVCRYSPPGNWDGRRVY